MCPALCAEGPLALNGWSLPGKECMFQSVMLSRSALQPLLVPYILNPINHPWVWWPQSTVWEGVGCCTDRQWVMDSKMSRCRWDVQETEQDTLSKKMRCRRSLPLHHVSAVLYILYKYTVGFLKNGAEFYCFITLPYPLHPFCCSFLRGKASFWHQPHFFHCCTSVSAFVLFL